MTRTKSDLKGSSAGVLEFSLGRPWEYLGNHVWSLTRYTGAGRMRDIGLLMALWSYQSPYIGSVSLGLVSCLVHCAPVFLEVGAILRVTYGRPLKISTLQSPGDNGSRFGEKRGLSTGEPRSLREAAAIHGPRTHKNLLRQAGLWGILAPGPKGTLGHVELRSPHGGLDYSSPSTIESPCKRADPI